MYDNSRGERFESGKIIQAAPQGKKAEDKLDANQASNGQIMIRENPLAAAQLKFLPDDEADTEPIEIIKSYKS